MSGGGNNLSGLRVFQGRAGRRGRQGGANLRQSGCKMRGLCLSLIASRRMPDASFWRAALATTIGFFVLGYGAILVTGDAGSTAILWPGNAFALCVMLRHARGWGQNGIILAGVFLADLLSNSLGGTPPLLTLGYSLINTLEITLCLAMAGPGRVPRLRNGGDAALFFLKVGVVPSLLGGMAAGLVAWAGGEPTAIADGRNWVFADTLGFLMVFPFAITVSWRQIAKLRLKARFWEALLAVSLLAGRLAVSERKASRG